MPRRVVPILRTPRASSAIFSSRRGCRRIRCARAAATRVSSTATTRARRVVDEAVARGEVVYGVTTGFGNFADVVIPREKLRDLQLNLLRSHAAGVGDALSAEQTRALMLLRANVLAK